MVKNGRIKTIVWWENMKPKEPDKEEITAVCETVKGDEKYGCESYSCYGGRNGFRQYKGACYSCDRRDKALLRYVV